MRSLTIATVLFCLLGLTARAGTQPATPRFVSLEEYLAQLDRLAGAVDGLDERQPSQANTLLMQVPRTWTVIVDNRPFEINADWIRRSLTDWSSRPTLESRKALAGRIRAIRSDAARYAEPPVGRNAARDRLNEILAAREFRGLNGPSWIDRLRQRAAVWLVNFLGRFLGSSAVPTITNLLVYLAIAVVVILVALWMYRSLGRSASLDSIGPGRIPMVARPWEAWLEDARAAAARGEWSDAIHLAYWCGISYLETQGAWRPDRSRTPREYLRVMKSSHEHRSTLQALTRKLEQVWYGAGDADAAAFDDVLAQLKKLGCPSI
jgi:hypothetical protein